MMAEYYKELLELKHAQQGLIESGIIRAVGVLAGELNDKTERGELNIKIIRSFYNKLNECLTALDKATNDAADVLKRYSEYIQNKE